MSAMNRVREIEIFINDKARIERTTTYGEIVSRFGLEPTRPDWLNHSLSGIFHILDLEDIIRERPLRTALVVNQQSDRPGRGFFTTAEEYGRFSGPTGNEDEELKYWIEELGKVFEFWKNR